MRRLSVLGVCVLVCAPAGAALRVVESVPVADFDVAAAGTVRVVDFTAAGPIAGVGLSADWIAVVADNGGGSAPWSADLSAVVTAPGGAAVNWPLIGGEISIADYPLEDAVGNFAGSPGAGAYTWTFGSVGGPWVAGLRSVEFHAMEQVPDVVVVIDGTTVDGPMWDRPFSIVGVSGLGPVSYDAIEFTVPVSGHYVLESVHPTGSDHWASLYEGVFDSSQSLVNQLDYGLGNGFATNGSPQGTALIESLLFTGRTYTIVSSQWASFRPTSAYTLTVTGPASIQITVACPADLDADGSVGAADLAVLLAAWGQGAVAADLNGDGAVDSGDLAELLAAWGSCP